MDEPGVDVSPAEGFGAPGARKRAREEPRVADEDPAARALLSLSGYCQEEWVRRMVKLHMFRGDRLKVALLSGDAGCGKSYAIGLLEKKLKALRISVAVSAMTNKAAGTLMESGHLDKVQTFHKMMGLKKDLLDDSLEADAFVERYRRCYLGAILAFRAFRRSKVDRAVDKHSCELPRPESCSACSRIFARLRGRSALADAPPFLGTNVLVVDEYGLMTARLLERMLRILALFYGPDAGPLIILAGSVSQLQPAGSGPLLWETGRMETLLCCSTPLFVNRRQFDDPGYAETLSYLQFNTVTQQSRTIFRSQLLVSERQAMDPEHEPHKTRIFHQDQQLAAYTKAYAARATRKAEVFLSVTKHGSSSKGPAQWYNVLQQATQALPKLFAMPRVFFKGGQRPRERDYLRNPELWVGCKVRMLWHMDHNGIQPVEDGPVPRKALSPAANLAGDPVSPLEVEGLISGMAFRKETQAYEFYVRGDRTGRLYKVGPSKWHCENWTVTTHPLACMLAMNTYDCQGCTISGEVLYHPPRNFSMSPIKPSVYVALSRVTRREKLQMTNCNFAESVGRVGFYDERLVAYRKRVEMNYSA
uniref:Helicase n=1 Tax=Oryzias latipes TaxID=8090 RepID=A0A286P9V6_ORYLA|nr:helicase [Oryzias latipes]